MAKDDLLLMIMYTLLAIDLLNQRRAQFDEVFTCDQGRCVDCVLSQYIFCFQTL